MRSASRCSTAGGQENVNTDLIQRMADRLPGLYYIETDDTGERTFYYWRNGGGQSSGWRAIARRRFAKSWPLSTICI